MSNAGECGSLARLQAMILDQITDAIIVIDRNGRIVFWNRGAERLCHFSARKALGKRPSEAQLSPWFSAEEETAVFSALERGEVWRRVAAGSNGNGRTMRVEQSIGVLSGPDADAVGFLVVMRDITGFRDRDGAQRLETTDRLRLLDHLMPICAHCKRIRDPGGSWRELDAYLNDQFDVKFTHGICPVCLAHLHADYCSRPQMSA